MENTGRNSFSTLVSTFDIFSPGCCLPQAEVGKKQTVAAAQQRYGAIRPLPLFGRGRQVFWSLSEALRATEWPDATTDSNKASIA